MTWPTHFGVRVASQFAGRAWPDTAQQQHHVWRILDEGGVDGIWTMDHVVGWGDGISEQIFDGWVQLSMIAALTVHARLGVEMTGVLYRHPAILAKIGSTIDAFSGGRLEMGLGASSGEREFRQLGMPFGPPPERIRQLDEACEVLKALWTQPLANFQGEHYHLTNAYHEPKPIQKPYPPIWIGGYGAKGTLRVAARHADVWNCSGGRGWDATLEAYHNLDTHCDRIGRDPATIRRSVQLAWGLDEADECYALTERYVREGFSEFIVDLADNSPALAETFVLTGLPRLRSIG